MNKQGLEDWIRTRAAAYPVVRGAVEKRPTAWARWLYITAGVVALLWTLLWLGTSWLVGQGDEIARAGAGLFGEHLVVPEWLVSAATSVQSISDTLLLVVWIVGLALIGLGAGVTRWLVGAFTRSLRSPAS